MPSGREKGPEKRMSTLREAFGVFLLGNWIRRGGANAASAQAPEGRVTPGGCVPWSSARCANPVRGELTGNQGNVCSSKYTSDVTTVRPIVGTQILYAPGERMLRPRLMPIQARGSMRVFEYACLGLMA
eukprot:4104605-Pleurochrysis_carterae.AAC.1